MHVLVVVMTILRVISCPSWLSVGRCSASDHPHERTLAPRFVFRVLPGREVQSSSRVGSYVRSPAVWDKAITWSRVFFNVFSLFFYFASSVNSGKFHINDVDHVEVTAALSKVQDSKDSWESQSLSIAQIRVLDLEVPSQVRNYHHSGCKPIALLCASKQFQHEE